MAAKEGDRMTQPLTMYTTPWCGYCRRLKNQLAREGIEITEVDIERDPEAADYVMKVNGGFQTVPTVLFGALRFTMLNVFVASARNSIPYFSRNLNSRKTARSTVLNPG